MKQEAADLSAAIQQLVDRHFSGLSKPVRKNLCRLTPAFLRLAVSVRFGYGGLHLTSIARYLPQGRSLKSSYKWLSRFLKCKFFDPSALAQCMLALVLGRGPPAWVIVLIDQTTIDNVQVVNAAIPLQGRAVPVAWIDFEYPWTRLAPPSQNTIERYLFTWVSQGAPPPARLIMILDRGYARVELIRDFNRARQLFILRAPGKVIVEAEVRGRRQRLSLGRLPHRAGVPVRYRHVLYHGVKQEPVDLIVYRGPGFRDAWFLIVPPNSEAWLPTEKVVALYRQRMQIEYCFRDWKSHLGLRGLRLQVQKPERLLRLLMGFTLAYLLALLLGQDRFAERLRPLLEIPRRCPRHGTRRILSVLPVALSLLGDERWRDSALLRLSRILSVLSRCCGVEVPSALAP
jgi:hypothetical protein